MPRRADRAQLGGVVARRRLVRRAGRAGAACARRAVERGNRRLHSIERRNAFAPSRCRASAASRRNRRQWPGPRSTRSPLTWPVAMLAGSWLQTHQSLCVSALAGWPPASVWKAGDRRAPEEVPREVARGGGARRGQREHQRQQQRRGARWAQSKRPGMRAQRLRSAPERRCRWHRGAEPFRKAAAWQRRATGARAAGVAAPAAGAHHTVEGDAPGRARGLLRRGHVGHALAAAHGRRDARRAPHHPARAERRARRRRARGRGPGRGRGRPGDRVLPAGRPRRSAGTRPP